MHQWLFEVKGGHGCTLWTHRHIEGRTLGRAASVGFVNVLNTTPTHGSHTGSDSEKKSSLAELQTQSRCEGQLTKKTLRTILHFYPFWPSSLTNKRAQSRAHDCFKVHTLLILAIPRGAFCNGVRGRSTKTTTNAEIDSKPAR